MRSKWWLSLGLAVSLFGLAGCGDTEGEENADAPPASESEAPEENESSEEPTNEETEEQQTPEPDLEGIPDVVAEVNGQQIPKDEFIEIYEAQFQQAAMQAQMSGQELDQDQLKQQVADSMVATELLVQEADSRSYTVSDEDISNTLDELTQASGFEKNDEFIAAMGEQGMDEQEVMAQLEKQVKVDRLVAEEAGETTPTEEELRELYDQVVAQQAQSGDQESQPPAFDEVKPQLEQQMAAQNEAEAVQALVAGLREAADVTVHV